MGNYECSRYRTSAQGHTKIDIIMVTMRRVWSLVALVSCALAGAHAQEDGAVATEPVAQATLAAAIPQHAEEPKALVEEDTNFDPYDENQGAKAVQAEENAQGADNGGVQGAKYQPKQRKVELFDFDPSEGLTFHVYSGKKECFYQDAKFTGDEISGAYIVSSADSHIDLEVKNPAGVVVYRRFGDAEGQYQVRPTEEGVHQLCFINSDSDGKLVTHVTNTLKSQHPVEREHVSVLAKYASHLDVRLGELESEQRLQQIRTDRFIKVEESTSQRVAFYGTLECFVYFLICLYQVLYIKGLLDGPRHSLPTRKTWA